MFNVGTISESKLLPAILHPKLMALCINLFDDLLYLLYKICIQCQTKEIGFRKIKLSANLFSTPSINKQVPGNNEKYFVYLSSSRNDNVPNYLRMTYNGFVNSTRWGWTYKYIHISFFYFKYWNILQNEKRIYIMLVLNCYKSV